MPPFLRQKIKWYYTALYKACKFIRRILIRVKILIDPRKAQCCATHSFHPFKTTPCWEVQANVILLKNYTSFKTKWYRTKRYDSWTLCGIDIDNWQIPYIVRIPGTDRCRPASEHQQIKYLKWNEGLTDVPGLITEEVRLTINPCLAYGHAWHWQVSKRVHCTVQLK